MKRRPTGREPPASDRLVGALSRQFHYSESETEKIAITLAHLTTSDHFTQTICPRLERAAAIYLSSHSDLLHYRQLVTEVALKVKHWRRVERLAQTLISEFEWHAADQRYMVPSTTKLFDRELEPLASMAAEAEYLIAHLGRKLSRTGNQSLAQDTYRFAVLREWELLGRAAKVSRHHKTHKISGRLARYFFAVTRPVQQWSPETLPGLIKRYERWNLHSKAMT